MGFFGCFYNAMNRPTVNTPDAVRDILGEYDVRPGLVVKTDAGTGSSSLAFADNEWSRWPSAVRWADLPEWPERADELSEDKYDELLLAEDGVHEEDGERGFIDLLLAVAPYLNAPLVFQAASFDTDGEFNWAKEWTVRPGATEVEVKEIKGMEDEYSMTDCG